ncbi:MULTISPECIES: glycerophosphodiester phosphodiesterase family protein [unclassified Rothia (in: high G+C Gram-positive bacteria)]|uniref:glycerophosphodiester phosphodiesterase family protein n=1 Tax=unclassified Rothia (in: high G+C Gram-positive bacteria) TaxID=2689056 RepID=UPI00195DAF46|nr:MULTISPECIES: glycerophosphodiester phosphodiesterase family protein [unclassified Rothia (in: high G+C Gram-positive bacteria)]MBM7051667.1 esterase [Rothia sp. ZJ1223]QRZ61695.1 esterase [Rothia sp. ZJ932]
MVAPSTSAEQRQTIERFAHRGFSLNAPENTLASFKDALDAGTQWLEIDVNTTVDGVPIVFHDPFLNRLTGHFGLVRNTPWKEIKELELEGGHRIPSLAEALEAFPEASFNIDMKDAASAITVPRVLSQVKKLPRVRITSFTERTRKAAYRSLAFYGLQDQVTLGASELSMTFLYLSSLIHPKMWSVISAKTNNWVAPIDAVQIPLTHNWLGKTWQVLTPRLLETAQTAGYQVHIWTIDEAERMRELIELGVDGIITNRTDILSRVLKELGR